jgi:hypothetical protein
MTRITGTLHEYDNTSLNSPQNEIKVVEKTKTDISYSVLFSAGIRATCELMWKSVVVPGRSPMTT